MKILLDHCVPRPFENLLPGHDVQHTSRLKWDMLENGKLLTAAEAEGFEVFLTVDQNIPFQQNLSGRKISIFLLAAPSNSIHTLRSLIELVLFELKNLNPGTIKIISAKSEHKEF